jgi:carbon monoxide dehydrogenase subunit G
MEISGERMIAAPQEQVWSALNDPEILKACLPGCETLEPLSSTEMAATAALQIGSIKALFAGKVLLSDLDPPYGYTISAEGQANTAGSASANAQFRLHDLATATKLTYAIHSSFEGELATLGQEVLETSTTRYANEFLDQLAAIIVQTPPVPHERAPNMIHLAHEDHDHDPTNPHYFGLPIGVILAGAVAVVSVGLVLAKFIF